MNDSRGKYAAHHGKKGLDSGFIEMHVSDLMLGDLDPGAVGGHGQRFFRHLPETGQRGRRIQLGRGSG